MFVVGLFILAILELGSCSSIPVPPMPVFSCPAVGKASPASRVTQLHPSNIKAVMALGDSISAGFAMKGIPLEYRGLVYSIGGDEYVSDWGDTKALTIPNFLKYYSPSLAGQAYGETIPLTKGAYLDAGVSMAKVEDVPAQIQYLVNTINTQYAGIIDMNNDWKLLTLFIGANNLCICCNGDSRGTPQYFENQLRSVLTSVQQTIPRTFVNIITIFNISGVWNAGQTSEYCRLLWDGITNSECPCLLENGDAGRLHMDQHTVLYNQVIEKLATEFSSQVTGNPNFTVVAQPGLSGFNITYFGENFLSALDCFHPGLPGEEAFTISIWNNMFQPPGQKQTTINPNNVQIICPTSQSVLQ